jgi:hypothetical protein
MMAGTRPSIAALPGGGGEVAFEANTTDLYACVPGAAARNLKLGMLAGTNPHHQLMTAAMRGQAHRLAPLPAE